MDTRTAYNQWASQYDTNHNRTRDLEAVSLRDMLDTISFDRCLEIGCGTGKNTVWLAEKSKHITAVDLSEEMLAKAKEKISAPHVHFRQADIDDTWTFAEGTYDLVTFSLVLEHIELLGPIFENVAGLLNNSGHVYLGELHPYKQYSGTKARFDTEEGRQVTRCYTHNITDFTHAAVMHGFTLIAIKEHFDDNDRSKPPRILSLLFRKD